jgi:hypothetical protein
MRLRPSLRAAVRLHAKHGLPDLAEMVDTGHLGAAADIITEGTDPKTARHLIEALRFEGVRMLDAWREPLTDFVFALLSQDRKAAQPQPHHAEVSPAKIDDAIEKRLEELFEIGTGWLGWSATDTWAATPTEILVAERGLVAKLKAVNGVTDKPEFDPREEVTQDQAKAGINKLRSMSGAKRKAA